MGLPRTQLAHIAQALRSHEAQVNGGAQGEQSLVRADIAGRLLAADVLFARLQRQHPTASPAAIHGLAGDTSGQPSHEFFAAGHDAQVGAAKLHRAARAIALPPPRRRRPTSRDP